MYWRSLLVFACSFLILAVTSATEPTTNPSSEQNQGLKSGKVSGLEGIIEEFEYDPGNGNKRDPFQPFTQKPLTSSRPQGPDLPLQRFDLDQLKVVGIIWDVPSPKAIILDPSLKSYYVSLNDKLGRYNGYVAAIREGEIVIVEASEIEGRLLYQSRILKLQKE